MLASLILNDLSNNDVRHRNKIKQRLRAINDIKFSKKEIEDIRLDHHELLCTDMGSSVVAWDSVAKNCVGNGTFTGSHKEINESLNKINKRLGLFIERLKHTTLNDIYLRLPSSALNQFWLPDTHFPNEKQSHVHQVTYPNQLLRVFSSGWVWVSSRITLLGNCNMTMSMDIFPFDVHTCTLVLGSYNYDSQNLKYLWLTKYADCETNSELEKIDCLKNTLGKLSKF